jgi:two-component sensor histidine kinase
LLAIEDVTERDASHRRQQMLASEMSHRVKNVLTLVGSIAAQTARSVSSLDDFQVVFHGRLTALARSHGQWLADDMQTASLHDLLEEVSDSSGLNRERITLEGPPVAIKPTQTMALNLTFHELCTNAIKYGAVSTDAGHIDVTWSVADGQTRLSWRETGGPVIEPPSSKGFGLQLIESLCPFELKGAAEIRFEPSGLQCNLRFPIS